MSELVYVGLVTDLEDIPKADNLLLATVVCGTGGKWTGIVRKDDFKIGDKANVYLPDSIPNPDDKDFDFLEKYRRRVKPMRFRGCPSTCLIMPLKYGDRIGQDVTEESKTTKYEKKLPLQMAGEAKGNFPSFIPKTDEPNFQKVPHLVDTLTGMDFYATVKEDGTSCTIYAKSGDFGVCSRNLEKKEGESVYWRMARKYGLDKSLLKFGEFAIQGEVVGPGIQANTMGLKEIELHVFDILDLNKMEYVNWLDLTKICNDLGLQYVHCIEHGYPFFKNTDDLLKYAEREYPNGHQVEGVVIRPVKSQYVLSERLSFKVINLNYERKG